MQIRLCWLRHSGGYRLEESGPTGALEAPVTILSGAEPTIWITQKGPGISVPIQNILAIDALYRRLADCDPTPESALAFINTFGLLRRGTREPAEEVCAAIAALRSLVCAQERGDIGALLQWAEDNSEVMRLVATVEPAAQPGAGAPPLDLIFSPRDLGSAIYFQFFRDLTADIRLRRCGRPGCGEWFQHGPGTRHRSTAIYCSPRCQHADAYRLKHLKIEEAHS